VRAEQAGSMMGMGGMAGGTTIGTCAQDAGGTHTMSDGSADPVATDTNVMGVQAGALQLAAAASAYGTAAAAMADVAACRSEAAAYDDVVRPMVQQMRAIAAAVDRRMMSMGQASSADVQCGADAMLWELDRHRSLACAAADMGPNRTEALGHAQAMTEWADHQRVRSEEMGSMMGVGGMMPGGGATGTCQRNEDGSYTTKEAPR
jgi:hypothetical protein